MFHYIGIEILYRQRSQALLYPAVYHCTSIHISQWLKINYGQRFYQICMIHELKFSSDTMFSDVNGKK